MEEKYHDDSPAYDKEEARGFEELVCIAEGPDGPMRDSTITTMEDIAERNGCYAMRMCELHFCSPCFVPDDVKAAEWAIRAAKLGYNPVGVWLMYLLRCGEYGTIEEDNISEEHYISKDFWGRGGYHPPCDSILHLTEFQILMAVTHTDMYGYTYLEGWENDGYGFENDTFAFRHESNNEDFWEDPYWLANFIFKPAGLELEWYKHMGKSEEINQLVSETDLRRMFVHCIESVRRDIGRPMP